MNEKLKIVEAIREFDFYHKIKNIILIGFDGHVRHIELEVIKKK